MTRKMIVHNVETNEVIERDFTDEENAAVEKALLKAAEEKAQAEAKAAQKAALLNRLGITEDEAKLLLA